MADLVRRGGSVAPDGRDWHFIHFQACQLAKGQSFEQDTFDRETAVVVLGGKVAMDVGSDTYVVAGRDGVWARTPPSVALVPPGRTIGVQAASDAEIVIASATAEDGGAEPRLITPDDVRVEERGDGQTLRYVHHLLPPSADAQRLILVEVYTPPGNWSSFPPHKHDSDDPPNESYLEEIYYYRIDPPTGFALQRVYTADGSLDEVIAARDRDVVLVPKGYHVVANTPGHECYYLNVMAGTSRVWNFTLDPAYERLMNWQKPE